MADDFIIRFPTLACDACGKPVEDGKKFCSHCGTPVDHAPPQPRLCQHCGDRLPPEATFCGACGRKVLHAPYDMPVVDNEGITVALPSSPSPPLAQAPLYATQAPPHGGPPPKADVQPNGFSGKLKAGLGFIAVLSVGILVMRLIAPERQSPAPQVSVPNPIAVPPRAKEIPHTTDVATEPASPPIRDIPARISDESPVVAPDLPKTTAADTQPVSPPATPRLVDSSKVQGQVVTPAGLLPIRIYGEAKTNPERSVEVIRERVEASLGPIRDSYTQALTRSSGLLGTLTLELTVGGDGHVEQSIAHATAFADTTFSLRVQDQAQQWRFPPASSGSVKIFYPLLFLPESLDPRAVLALSKELLPGRYKIIVSDPTSVHQEPNEEATTVGTVSSGLKVYIVSSQGDWLGVLSPKGEVGYIKREAIASALQSAQ